MGGPCPLVGVEVAWTPYFLRTQGSPDQSWVPQRDSSSSWWGCEWRPRLGTRGSCYGPAWGWPRPWDGPDCVGNPLGGSRTTLTSGPGVAEMRAQVGYRRCVWAPRAPQPHGAPSQEACPAPCVSFHSLWTRPHPPVLRRV